MVATQANPELLVAIDRSNPRALRAAVESELRRAIQSGRLAPGATLPPSRSLAGDLGVARSVVVGAYGNLVADGYLEARQGSGTRVRPLPAARPVAAGPPGGRAAAAAFLGGPPPPPLFPPPAWRRHHPAALDTPPHP